MTICPEATHINIIGGDNFIHVYNLIFIGSNQEREIMEWFKQEMFKINRF